MLEKISLAGVEYTEWPRLRKPSRPESSGGACIYLNGYYEGYCNGRIKHSIG